MLRETVGFQSEGKELAQILNSDANLKNLLYPADKLARAPSVEIKPYREIPCIKIVQKRYASSPASALPTA